MGRKRNRNKPAVVAAAGVDADFDDDDDDDATDVPTCVDCEAVAVFARFEHVDQRPTVFRCAECTVRAVRVADAKGLVLEVTEHPRDVVAPAEPEPPAIVE